MKKGFLILTSVVLLVSCGTANVEATEEVVVDSTVVEEVVVDTTVVVDSTVVVAE